MDRERNEAIYWVQTVDSLPYWVHASPVRTLFHWWMEKNDCQLLHAAAVGNERGAVVITGKGGVGKSTTALTCLADGLRYLADDYLVVRLDPEPTVYSLYSTAKLNADQLEKFPQFANLVTNQQQLDEEKAVMFLHPKFDDQIVASAPLRAFLTPRIAKQSSTGFASISQTTLRRAASFTTMSQLPYANRKTHNFIDRMTERIPGLELTLGYDLGSIADAIDGLLQQSNEKIAELARIEGQKQIEAERPLVSVIVPVYNGAGFLNGAIENIMSQHYSEIEIIVVDDGSTDDIDDAVEQITMDVRYFKQKNAGAAAARNRGIKDASGDFIAFLDVDDLWPENNLAVMVDALLKNSEVDLVHGYGQLMELDGQTGYYEYVGNPEESFPFYIGAALYRRAAFEKVGLFDTELQFAEDTDWFNRAYESQIDILRLREVTLLVRRHGENMTHGKSLVELNTLRVFKKALDRKREQKVESEIALRNTEMEIL